MISDLLSLDPDKNNGIKIILFHGFKKINGANIFGNYPQGVANSYLKDTIPMMLEHDFLFGYLFLSPQLGDNYRKYWYLFQDPYSFGPVKFGSAEFREDRELKISFTYIHKYSRYYSQDESARLVLKPSDRDDSLYGGKYYIIRDGEEGVHGLCRLRLTPIPMQNFPLSLSGTTNFTFPTSYNPDSIKLLEDDCMVVDESEKYEILGYTNFGENLKFENTFQEFTEIIPNVEIFKWFQLNTWSGYIIQKNPEDCDLESYYYLFLHNQKFMLRSSEVEFANRCLKFQSEVEINGKEGYIIDVHTEKTLQENVYEGLISLSKGEEVIQSGIIRLVIQPKDKILYYSD